MSTPRLDILLIRHGATEWNRRGLIQGHTDVDLSEAGRAALAGLGIPPAFARARCVSSPLRRAVATARALGIVEPELEPRLMEMNWGEWEGRRRDVVRAESPEAVSANERRGADFRPPGGESPREVQARLVRWAAAVAADTTRVVAVTHKGVIKAALGLATGWDLTGRSPVKLDWTRGHRFGFDPATGAFSVIAANVPLREAA